MDLLLFILVLLCIFGTGLCGEYCYDTFDTFYCKYGCCGHYGDEYCCGVYSWVIAVAVIGSIALISVAVIIFCVVKKKKLARGRVLNHSGQQQVHTTVVHAPPQPNGFQMQPTPYQQPPPGFAPQQQGMYPPPPSMDYGANPAYPPPH